VNINVITKAHRDQKDLRWCLVIALGEGEGGELCLYEAGIVVALRTGDFILFPSGKLTHFNLHFKGKRASLVFHTDEAGDSWSISRNGWASNKFFKST
jgi:hypothetical protein